MDVCPSQTDFAQLCANTEAIIIALQKYCKLLDLETINLQIAKLGSCLDPEKIAKVVKEAYKADSLEYYQVMRSRGRRPRNRGYNYYDDDELCLTESVEKWNSSSLQSVSPVVSHHPYQKKFVPDIGRDTAQTSDPAQLHFASSSRNRVSNDRGSSAGSSLKNRDDKKSHSTSFYGPTNTRFRSRGGYPRRQFHEEREPRRRVSTFPKEYVELYVASAAHSSSESEEDLFGDVPNADVELIPQCYIPK